MSEQVELRADLENFVHTELSRVRESQKRSNESTTGTFPAVWFNTAGLVAQEEILLRMVERFRIPIDPSETIRSGSDE